MHFEKILSEQKKVGIFSVTDRYALSLFQRMLKKGIIPGEHIKLAGFDDLRFASQLQPGLSTIRQPMRMEGKIAIRKLVNMIFGKTEKNETLKPELVVRGSTDPTIVTC